MRRLFRIRGPCAAAAFWGHFDRVVRWENPGIISLADSRVVPFTLKGPMIDILSGSAMIHDNSMGRYPGVPGTPETRTAVHLGAHVDQATAHGNQFGGCRLVNDAGQRVILANNLP